MMPHFHAFHRAKDQKVVAEYVVIDKEKLDEANYDHFPSIGETNFVAVTDELLKDTNVLKDYLEVMRLCKTYIADPVIFDLCRQIEKRIAEVLAYRFFTWGMDRCVFEDKPFPLKKEPNNGSTKAD